MIHRRLRIGRWLVDFYFATDGYDIRRILNRLGDIGAPEKVILEAYEKMRRGFPNEGFTWADERVFRAVVVVGAATRGGEFLDSFVHEIGHLSDHIAHALGVELDSERSKYILGDTAREFIDVVCLLGCSRCAD